MPKKPKKSFNNDDVNLDKIRLAKKAIFYGENNCISCTYVLPLINYGIKNNWFLESEIHIYKSKEEYIERGHEVLDKYNIEEISAPLLELKTFDDKTGLVKPDIMAEISGEIMEHFKVLGDDQFFDYMENAMELNIFFANLVFKMTTGLLYLDEVNNG